MGGRPGQTAVEAYRQAKEGASTVNYPSERIEASKDELRESSGERILRASARQAEASASRAESENALRKKVGKSALKLVWVQLIVCDLVVAGYVVASFALGREVPGNVLVAWITAAVVEVIGILWVIARSLFPFRDSGKGSRR